MLGARAETGARSAIETGCSLCGRITVRRMRHCDFEAPWCNYYTLMKGRVRLCFFG